MKNLCCLINPEYKCDQCKQEACTDHEDILGWRASNWCKPCWYTAQHRAQKQRRLQNQAEGIQK